MTDCHGKSPIRKHPRKTCFLLIKINVFSEQRSLRGFILGTIENQAIMKRVVILLEAVICLTPFRFVKAKGKHSSFYL